MSTILRYYAALLAPYSIPHYIKQCRVIVTKMTGNPNLPNPTVDLGVVSKHIDDLDDAEQATLDGPKGAVADRNAKLLVVRSDMRLLKEYTQSRADSDLGNAQAIIESSGMSVVKRMLRSKPELAIKYGESPGVVALRARAKKGRVSYKWQMRTEQGTWIDLPETLVASTEVTGLTPVTLYFFRFRTVTKGGISDWSAPFSIIAH